MMGEKRIVLELSPKLITPMLIYGEKIAVEGVQNLHEGTVVTTAPPQTAPAKKG